MSDHFTHFDAKGQAHMVDVGDKAVTERVALATGSIRMQAGTLAMILEGDHKKGDVLGVARLAGIAATKKTSDLIPLAHPLALHHAAINFEADRPQGVLKIRCTVRAHEKTGVEMEAMTGASVAALASFSRMASKNSPAALRVKVSAMIRSGSTPCAIRPM